MTDTTDIEPIVDPEAELRPDSFSSFIGQSELKDILGVYVYAAKQREEALDHVLLHGPPGLGKTTIARIIANELDVGFRKIMAPMIEKPGDLASILVNLENRDVLFIDEIHRLPAQAEELLYSAMEDYQISILIGSQQDAQAVTIDLKPFTLVGATTRQGMLTKPLRDRFGIPLRLDYYAEKDLRHVVQRASGVLGITIDGDAAMEIARRSRGTPRVAGKYLRRVRDFAGANDSDHIDAATARDALTRIGVSEDGLDEIDRRYMDCLRNTFRGGPVGIKTLAAALSEEISTIEDVIEPFLLQRGMIRRTARGRLLDEEQQGALL